MIKRVICLICLIFFAWGVYVNASDYTQQQTWVTDEVITATKLNVDIAGIIAVINNLDDDNISASAAIVASKLDLSSIAQDMAIAGDITMTGAIALKSATADPCGTDAEGSIFWNTTDNEVCVCDGTNDVRIKDASTACF